LDGLAVSFLRGVRSISITIRRYLQAGFVGSLAESLKEKIEMLNALEVGR
jgi:hypothetical protein